MRPTRRTLLKGMGAAAVGAASLPLIRRVRAGGLDGPRYVVVLGCFGGASILDSFLPVDVADAHTDPDRGTVIAYPTVQPAGSNIRCVDRPMPRAFLERHAQHSVVMATQSSSVNHFVAQARAVNGRDTFGGRTLTEAVAALHGADMPLPNVSMGRGGFADPGRDATLDGRFRAEVVAKPVVFPLSTSGHAGVAELGPRPFQDPALRQDLVGLARTVRDEQLERVSPFAQTFATARRRRDLLWSRANTEPRLEQAELIRRLFFVEDLGDILPLTQYGLGSSAEASRVVDALPGSFPQDTSGNPDDRLQAQAALAYLLLRTGASTAVTLTEPGTDGFLAFDQSHQSHRDAQAVHWDRVLDVADRLIGLLQTAEHEGPDGPDGTSMWDRTMIVFATEFGRDKWDPGSSFGTGHHLNNGLLVVSPLLRGNQSLGEADPNNGFTTGWDPITGASTPYVGVEPGLDPLFTDPNLPPAEEPVFGTLLKALGVEYEGQQTLPVVLPA